MPFSKALESFLSSDKFREATDSNSSVELFEDGTWRIHPPGSIRNRYQSPGVILPIYDVDNYDITESLLRESAKRWAGIE